ncbi:MULTISPECIES: hypothetical protein [unclassified Janthinobacterium]|uniref:hypothetical protein n=1 Tax=unclassified Janthinobacterium TaxID=2610881 RepID=UPI00161CF418|nr:MULTISPECIES: hypothetical protein [unclassified Janthinobacterium]MBB5606957.1 hypothetical protein [Janthinobacterium sp. S3T4]MBB5612683.1 hypothetical protein [Janthinobacterium sp. S3M3]
MYPFHFYLKHFMHATASAIATAMDVHAQLAGETAEKSGLQGFKPQRAVVSGDWQADTNSLQFSRQRP